MKAIEFKKLWKSEEEKSFVGWDFSYLDNRIKEEELPWNYKDIVNSFLHINNKLLDMGTGGGEFLLKLKHPYQNTYVTESYLPNVNLCKERLGKLGIDVRQVVNDSELPFENETIDIIINRQASYDISEVFRVLNRKGMFITQQVGAKNNLELSKFLLRDDSRIMDLNYTLEMQVKEAKKIGFNIIRTEEFFPYLNFFDVGALVYFAKIIEWEFPNFSVDKCFDQLMEVHKLIELNGFVSSQEHRFLIVAKKE